MKIKKNVLMSHWAGLYLPLPKVKKTDYGITWIENRFEIYVVCFYFETKCEGKGVEC